MQWENLRGIPELYKQAEELGEFRTSPKSSKYSGKQVADFFLLEVMSKYMLKFASIDFIMVTQNAYKKCIE